MSLELWLSNLWFYSLQAGILILVGGLLAWTFRLREPGGLHHYWRLLLAGCLVLAFQPVVPESLPDPVAVPSLGVSILTASQAANVSADPVTNWYPWLGGLLVSGILLRLIWLGIGLFRLRRLRLNTVRLPLPRQVQMLKEKLGVFARFRVSAEVSGPITFGCLRPVVVFPQSFTKLDAGMQRAVACHELLHVKRRDWLWNTLDEIVKTLFWFHPGFHWLVGRIQLTREQVVDEQAVILLGSRKTYLRSLVEIAKRGRSAPLPAPLFLKESQLGRRVRLLLQVREVKMSKAKTRFSLGVSLVMLAVTGWWSLAAMPLTAPPSAPLPQAESEVQEPVQVGSNVMKSKLALRVQPEYPDHLTASRPTGHVILSAVVGKSGEVQQVEVLRGDESHPALNSVALEAVKLWRYKPFTLDGKPVPVRTTVIIRFPPAGIDRQLVDEIKEGQREIERTRKELERVRSEIAGIYLKELETVRKELERARSEIVGIDLKKLERARKLLERARSEIPGIDLKELERAQKELERVWGEMAEIDLQILADRLEEIRGQLKTVRKKLERPILR